MRIDVVKYLISGSKSHKEQFFKRVQELGIVEFLAPKKTVELTPREIQTYLDAIHILHGLVPTKQIEPGMDHLSPLVVAQKIVEANAKLERYREEVRVIKREIARIQVFGEFSLEEIKELENQTKRHFQFFFAKRKPGAPPLKTPENVIYVGSAYELDYYLGISEKPQPYPGLTEIKIDTSLGELYERLAQRQKEIDEAEIELATYSHYQPLLKQGLYESLNAHHLNQATDVAELYLEGEIFAIEGWIPENKIPQIEKLADELHLIATPIKVEKEDRVPTYLENKGASRLGEDLVSIYDIPSHSDRDPSLWVFIAFGLFFSMIIADAIYGLILLGISLTLLYKVRHKQGLAKRVLKLSTFLSIGCIIWGVLSASYMGIEIPYSSPLRKVSVIDWMANKKADYALAHKDDPLYQEWVKQFPDIAKATDARSFFELGSKKDGDKVQYLVHEAFVDDVLLELVLMIGTIHIFLSFLRYLDRNWAGLGWMIFLVGGYLYFPTFLKATSMIHYLFGISPEFAGAIGFPLLMGGIGLAVVLAVIQKRLGGLAEAMNVIQVFADVMSYLRIYALSLAGMVMGSTFMRIGLGLPLYVGWLVILGGHSVNFVLALMGGIIHGLRLNFIEWYHYSFEGGGKPFRPLSLLKME